MKKNVLIFILAIMVLGSFAYIHYLKSKTSSLSLLSLSTMMKIYSRDSRSARILPLSHSRILISSISKNQYSSLDREIAVDGLCGFKFVYGQLEDFQQKILLDEIQLVQKMIDSNGITEEDCSAQDYKFTRYDNEKKMGEKEAKKFIKDVFKGFN